MKGRKHENYMPKIREIRFRPLLCAGLLFLLTGIFSTVAGQIDFSLVTPEVFIVDNQECDMPGPRAAYIGVRICNNSGADLSGLTAEVDLNKTTNLSVDPFLLAGDQPAGQIVAQAGELPDGNCDVLYWYVGYPCTAEEEVEVTVTLLQDGMTLATGAPFTMRTEAKLSANNGGDIVTQELGPGIFLGQIFYIKVRYTFGNVNKVGDVLTMQPAGNQDFNAGCFQLISSEVVATENNSGNPINSLFTMDNEFRDQISYVITDMSQLTDFTGTGNEIEIKYFFRANCLGESGTAFPYASNTGGSDESYSNNFGQAAVNIPGATNALEITKVADPTALTTPFDMNNPEEVTYTVTLTNNATSIDPDATAADLAISVDKISDILPGNFSFKTLLGSDDFTEVTANNSSAIPTSGATGAIEWVGGKNGMLAPFPYSTYYIEGQGGFITLTYTANVPEEIGEFTNLVTATIGSETVGPATSRVTVDLSCPDITAVTAPGQICADAVFSTMATGLSNMDIAGEQFGIEFVTFPSLETDPAVIYNDGASLGTVPFADLEDGGAKATLGNVSYTGTGSSFYIYAILDPPPAGAGCRPFAATNVTIADDPEIRISGGTAVCEGGTATLSAVTLGGTGICSIRWQQSTDGGTTWTDIPDETGETLTVTPAATTDYRAVYSCTGLGCGTALSNVETVTVEDSPDITISGETTICTDGTATLTAVTRGGAGICIIQWEQSTDGGTTWALIEGEESASLPVEPAVTTSYRATYSCTGSNCLEATSNVVTVTVVPDPQISISGGDTEVCPGNSVTLTAAPSDGAGTCTIQWQQSTDGGATWTDINGEMAATLTVTPSATTDYRATYSCTGGGCDVAVSNTQRLAVVDAPAAIVQGGGTICEGGDLTLTVSANGGTGGCTRQWQQTTDGGATWTDIMGETGSSLPVSPAVTTTYRVIYECAEGVCDPVISNAETVTVVEDPSVSITGGTTICAGGEVTLTATPSGGAGDCALQWQRSTDGGTTWTDITGAILASQTVSPTETTAYRVTYTCTGSDCDQATSNMETVTVIPGPVTDLTFESGETTETICVGTTTNILYSVALPQDATCTWSLIHQSGAVIVSGNTSTDGVQMIEVPGGANLPIGTYTYRLSVNCDMGGCIPQDKVITLTVNPVNGIACHAKINVTLDDETCSKIITPEMVGAGSTCSDYLIEVIVYDGKYGPDGPDNVLDTCGWFNYVLMYDENEYCWGQVNGEDKTPPVINVKPPKVHGIFTYTDADGGEQQTPYGLSASDISVASFTNLEDCPQAPNERYTDPLAADQLGYEECFEDGDCFEPGTFRFNRLICEDIDQVYQVEASWSDPSYPYYTGFPQVTDACGEPVELVRVTDWLDEFTCAQRVDQATSILKRTFTFRDSKGNVAEAMQEICFYRPEVFLPDCEIRVDLCEFEALGGNNALLSPGNLSVLAEEGAVTMPYYFNGKGEKIELSDETCDLSVSFTDRQVNTQCGYQFVRTWSFFDWCFTDVDTRSHYTFDDALSCFGSFEQHEGFATALDDDADFIQRITVEALNPMEVIGQDMVVSAGPFDCTAVVQPPAPEISGCISADFEFEVWGYVNDVHSLERGYQLIGESSNGYLAKVPVGVYDIYYRVKDECGRLHEAGPIEVNGVFEPNEDQAFRLEVRDDVEPVAICDDALNVSLGGTNTAEGGLARLKAVDVDEGSWDNCSPVTLSIRRLVRPECIGQYETVTGRTVNENGYTNFEEDIYFTCCDVGTTVTVELRVVDEAGNENICWLEIVPENKTRPRCLVTDQTISCLQLDFDPADSAQVAARFGAPMPVSQGGILEVDNNCSTLSITEQQSFLSDNCGTGVLRRTFTVDNGFSTAACTQTITITEVNAYSINFPGDLKSDVCGANPMSGVTTFSDACDVLAVSVDTTQFAASGNECFKKTLTYRVINWCEYDGESLEPTKVIRDVDGDGDLTEHTLLETGFETGIRSKYPICETERVYIPDEAFIVKIFDAETDGTPKRKEPVKIMFRGDCTDGDGGFKGHVGTLVLRLKDPSGQDGKPCYEVYCPGGEQIPTSAEAYEALIAESCRDLAYGGQCWTPGYYEYVQAVKVYDNEPPQIRVTDNDEFCAFGDPEGSSVYPCGTAVRLSFSIADACTPNDLSARNVRLLIDGDASQTVLPASGLFTVTETAPGSNTFLIEADALPVGRHTVLMNAVDGCGNVAGERIDFEVTDCKTPAPVCIRNLTVDLMPVRDGDQVGMNTIFATDFVASPARDCTPHPNPDILSSGRSDVRYYVFKDSELADGPASINLDSLTEEHRSAIFTCEDGDQSIVYVVGLDGAGNFDYCTVLVDITPGNDVDCDDDGDINIVTGTIAGLITNESLEAVEQVSVQLSGKHSGQQQTLDDGLYAFEALEAGYDYSVTPQLDQDPLEGVSTFDLVLVSKHILGVKPLDSPYKIIAADANKSNSVTTLDLIQLRKLILGLDSSFRNNTSWRFVAADYVFPNPQNPWQGNFPEVISVNDLEGDLMDADFVALKIGDVNGSARANSAQAAEVRSTAGTFHLKTADQELKAGQEYTIDVSSAELADIQGYQLTFELDRNAVELIDIQYGLATEDHFGIFADQGMVTMSWNANSEQPTANNTPLFSLVLKAQRQILLSEALSISSRITRAEAYSVTDELMDVALDFDMAAAATTINAPSEGYQLYQNQPNPLRSETVVGFELPTASEVTLMVRDLNGRTVYTLQRSFDAGYQEVVLNRFDLAPGLLYYTLKAGDFSATRKMVVVE